MPQAAKRACRKAGCPALTDSGYCEAHKASETLKQSRWRGSSTERGYDGAWRKVRGIALKRDKYLCQNCMKTGRVTIATEVHHIRKVTTHPHLRLTLSNLLSVCRDCHEMLEKA